jgi:hypothetical protein
MDGDQAGKEVTELAVEIGIALPAGIDVQEFADRFNGQNFTVGRPRCRTALAQLGTEWRKKSSMVQKTAMLKLSRSMVGYLWQQTGVAGCSPLQESHGSQDPKLAHRVS